MLRKTVLLLSTAALAGCAVSELPLPQKPEEMAVVAPVRNTPTTGSDEFAALEQVNRLDTVAPRKADDAAPAIPRPEAPSRMPAKTVAAAPVVPAAPLVMAAKEDMAPKPAALQPAPMPVEVEAPQMVAAEEAVAPTEIPDVISGESGLAVAAAAKEIEEAAAPAPQEPAMAEAPEPVEETPMAEEMPAPEMAAAAPVRRLEAEGRSGADALTAAQTRYVAEAPAEMEAADEIPEEVAPILADLEESLPEEDAAPVMAEAEEPAPVVPVAVPDVVRGEAAPIEAPTPAAAPRVVADLDGGAPEPERSADVLQIAAARAVTAVNTYRAENGLAPLAYSEALSEVAKAHVIDLAARNEVSSSNVAGEGIGVRLQHAGYEPLVAGSLVSGGYQTFESALESWIANETQNSRLLIETADEIGFAVISDRRSTYGVYIETIIASSTADDE